MNDSHHRARMVVVASDNRSVHEWFYRFLRPYEVIGYTFTHAENETGFSECTGKAGTVMAFIEDVFFGEKTIGKLDYFRSQYPKLRLIVFSTSRLSSSAAARYVSWSRGSYLSLRDSEKGIKEALEVIFRKQLAIPIYLRDNLDDYNHLIDIKPYLTHREIEIVRFTAKGKTVKETASALMISHRTVTGHLANIYRKFKVRNMVEVLKLAVSTGILPVDEIMSYKTIKPM